MNFRLVLMSLFFLFTFVLIGCSEEEEIVWTETTTFEQEDVTMYGTEGKFGLVRLNGEPNEPDFPAMQGRFYEFHFLDETLEKNGKPFILTATNKDTNETVEIAGGNVWSQGGLKIGFDQEGLWNIHVMIEEEPYTNFIIQVDEIQ